MSRLDSFIKRVTAQRDCLNAVARRLGGRPGTILELGLGNGRTYDHLRELFPGHAIVVLDRAVAAHPACIPPDDMLVLGDFRDTLPRLPSRLAGQVILAHGDFGSSDAAATAALAGFVGPALAPLLAPGGFVVTDQPLQVPGWLDIPPPASVPAGRYFIWQAGAP